MFWAGIVALTANAAQAEIRALTYMCERGVEIPAVYVNHNDELAVVVLWVEGRMITLERAPAASGARYQFPNDGSGYIWWSKGSEATLGWYYAETGEEVTLYAFCSAG
ncbi:MliC family protein [Loktanella agnita]|uniref:MliC family protein n=1 Tax=Loktanella agnita TaxID=287097 RepID=UPI0039885C96